MSIMGVARLSAAQLVVWFNGRQPRPAGVYAAAVPVDVLATIFHRRGHRRGRDRRWSRLCKASSRQDGFGSWVSCLPRRTISRASARPIRIRRPPSFPTRGSVLRAQIQHLRAYADPTALTCPCRAAQPRASIRGSIWCSRRASATVERHGQRQLGDRQQLCGEHPSSGEERERSGGGRSLTLT